MSEKMKVKDFVKKVQHMDLRVMKRGKNEHHKSTFSTLKDVLTVLNPILKEYDVLIRQRPVFKGERGWEFDTTIEIGDDSETDSLPIYGAKESKMAMQYIASTITFFRRHALIAKFNLICADDDGNVTLPPRPKKEDKKAAGDRKQTIEEMKRAFAALKVTVKELEARHQMEVDSFGDAQISDLQTVYQSMKKGGKPKEEFFNMAQFNFGIDPQEPLL